MHEIEVYAAHVTEELELVCFFCVRGVRSTACVENTEENIKGTFEAGKLNFCPV